MAAQGDPSSPARDGAEVGLADAAYDELRREILSGRLRPNQALVEADIADRFGVSRMPVRESLNRLAGEGLVRSQRRRWVVHEHGREEVRWIYEVRAALESEAGALAAARATEPERRLILEAGAPGRIAEAATHEGRLAANEAFHGRIVAAARNRRLSEMLRRNVTYFNFRFALLSSRQELAESGQQHADLSGAIARGDAERSRALSHDHVMHALRIIERAMD